MIRGRAGEEVALRLACLERRVDPSPRLVLSDWLEERGRGAEAAAERAEAERLMALPAWLSGPLAVLWSAIITDDPNAAKDAATELRRMRGRATAEVRYAFRTPGEMGEPNDGRQNCVVVWAVSIAEIVVFHHAASTRYSTITHVYRRADDRRPLRRRGLNIALNATLGVRNTPDPGSPPQFPPQRLPAPVPGCARVDVLSGAAVTAYDFPAGEPLPDADGWRALYYDCAPEEADRYHHFLAALDPPGWAVHLYHRTSLVVR